MLATHTTGMDLFLPPIVRFHDVPAHTTTTRITYAPALSFHQQATAQQAIDALRQMDSSVDSVYYLFVTDSQERLVGVVSLRQLICAAPGSRLFEFMDRRKITLPHDATLEEQAHLMSESGLLALPVVDEKGRLVGAMDTSDLIQAMQHESTATMYHLAGVCEDESISQSGTKTATYRTLWLASGLVIACLMAWIINSFGNTLASVAMLAVFFPLILKPGEYAGMQALTFMVRSLGLGHCDGIAPQRLLNRELLGGLINGAIIGSIAGIFGWLWQGQIVLGLILGITVLWSLLLAVLVGAGIPLVYRALHVDVSRSSTMIVTTATNICSIVCFLGLGIFALHMGYL